MITELEGQRVNLRVLTMDDCTPRYVEWLNDPEVNRYLETRWHPQTLDTIRDYVEAQRANPDVYLMAIIDRKDGQHVGNIKLGPINKTHQYADVSYFVGERDRWGKGLATDAVKLITEMAFARLKLHRVQAGIYEVNYASQKVLRRSGFMREGALFRQLKTDLGWCDHVLWGRNHEGLR